MQDHTMHHEPTHEQTHRLMHGMAQTSAILHDVARELAELVRNQESPPAIRVVQVPTAGASVRVDSRYRSVTVCNVLAQDVHIGPDASLTEESAASTYPTVPVAKAGTMTTVPLVGDALYLAAASGLDSTVPVVVYLWPSLQTPSVDLLT